MAERLALAEFLPSLVLKGCKDLLAIVGHLKESLPTLFRALAPGLVVFVIFLSSLVD